MSNVVIYARYSSQGQNEQSIEGQLRVCNEFALSKGYNVVKVYVDKTKSAWKEDVNRPDFEKMLIDALSGSRNSSSAKAAVKPKDNVAKTKSSKTAHDFVKRFFIDAFVSPLFFL